MHKFLFILFAILISFGFQSCDKETDGPVSGNSKRTVLVYAVASNNLDSYLKKDMAEMIEAAPDVAGLGKDVHLLLYSVASKSATEATLAELTATPDGGWEFQTIKSYDRDTYSTDPRRMSQVFSDVREISESDSYGLIMWSHGTGWTPEFYTHEVPGLQRSFGMDTYQGVTDKCDIMELAEAIPDRMFDYIWFDACYMMGVEVAYQLRGKCDYIGGYPTEDWSPGMNYETTLPMLVASEPDLTGAAKAFFNYYNNSNMAVTVTVLATKGLERLAGAAANIYTAGTRPENADGMQDYGRSPYPGLYDFGQFTRAYLGAGSQLSASDRQALLDAFDTALSETLLYGGCSSKDFNGIPNAFDPDIYSGMSCHFPGTSSASRENYFKNLDWTKATNP